MADNCECFKVFYSPRPFATAQFSLRGVGWREPMAEGFVDRPRGTGDWLIMYFYDPVGVGGMGGAGTREIGGGLLIWEPGEAQYYGNAAAGYVHSWLHCEGALVREALTQAGLHGGVWPAGAQIAAALETLVRELHTEASLPEPDARLACACFTVFARRLARHCAARTADNAPAALLRLKALLEAQPERRLDLAQMAQVACLSRTHLCAQFRRWFGRPPLDYQTEQRMALARYLLHDTNLRIGEVARRSGYEDIFYFSKLFKRRTGLAPAEFRHSCLRLGNKKRSPRRIAGSAERDNAG